MTSEIQMERFEEIYDAMKSWYGRELPAHMGHNFYRFAIRTHELANVVMGMETKLEVKAGIPTACCDGEKIYLPAHYFSTKFYDQFGVTPGLYTAAATACINGSQIHESFHLHETVCILVDMLSPYVGGHFKAKEWLDKPGFAQILQLVEDLYIEEWGRKNTPFLSDPFINCKNDILFTEDNFAEIIERLKDDKQSDQGTVLNAVSCIKNIRYKGDERLNHWSELVDCLEQARHVGVSKEKRVKIAIQAYKMLKNQTAENGANLGEMKTDEYGEGGIDSVIRIDSSEKFKVDLTSMENGKIQKWLDSLDGEDELALKHLAYKVNEEIEKEEKRKVVSKDNGEEWPELRIVPVLDLGNGNIEVDHAFDKMGNALRYAREVKHTQGQPRNHGSKILSHRLSHIISDEKVLAFPDNLSLKRGKPEVIFLMDFSGSMGPLAYEVAQATLGCHLSLIKAGVPVATYAHTSSDTEKGDTPTVYSIAAFDMPMGSSLPVRHSIENTKQRFGASGNIYKNENFDGVAIEYTAKQFTKRQGSKILIVLSDGSPHGGAKYGGAFAETHTKNAINQARKKGVDVFSLSLTHHVMEDNDGIYGKDNNFSAWNEYLDISLKKLAYQVSLNKK